MPKINSQSWQDGHSSADGLGRSFRIFLACVLLTVLVIVGCKKHETVVSSRPSPTDQAAVAPAGPSPHGPGPMAPDSAAAVVPDTGDMNSTLHDLSLELRKYVVRTRTVPKTFEEFAAKSRVQMPPAPAGKKYAIQGQAVVLVKN